MVFAGRDPPVVLMTLETSKGLYGQAGRFGGRLSCAVYRTRPVFEPAFIASRKQLVLNTTTRPDHRQQRQGESPPPNEDVFKQPAASVGRSR